MSVVNFQYFSFLIVLLAISHKSYPSSKYLKSLNDAKTTSISTLDSKKVVTLLFKPNCVACYKQIKELKCIEKDFEIILLGGFSYEKKLRREYFRLKTTYPAYLASPDILESLNIKNNYTPQIFNFSKTSQPISIGFTRCVVLKAKLEKL